MVPYDEMIDPIRERILIVMREMNITLNSICENDNSARMKFSRQISTPRVSPDGKGGVSERYAELSVRAILTIARAVPELSMDWLLLGKGEPYNKVDAQGDKTNLSGVLARLEALEKQIRHIDGANLA